MMDRRAFLIAVGTPLGLPKNARAQQQARRALRRVGVLMQTTDPDAPIVRVFKNSLREGLREAGIVEGQNFELDYRWGALEDLPRLAGDMVRSNIDVIFAGGTGAGLAAKKSTSTIPIVVAAMADPVADGLVTNLAKPGANVTGTTHLSPELGPKRLQLLKEVLPQLSRLGVLEHPLVYSEPTMREMVQAVRSAAAGVEIRMFQAKKPSDFGPAFSDMVKARMQAALPLPSPMFYVEHRELVSAATAAHLPTIYWFREAVDAGGLMCYGPNFPDIFRRSAEYVAKILNGAKPGDLPVEQPVKFDLLVNRKTANALGLMIPQSLLVRADRVIQ